MGASSPAIQCYRTRLVLPTCYEKLFQTSILREARNLGIKRLRKTNLVSITLNDILNKET